MCEISQGSYAPENAGETLEIVDWLLTNPWIVACDSVMTTFPQGALAIRGDTLVAVGPAAEITARFRGIREMDLRGHLVLPGLINTHTHAAMSCFRGLADDLPLSEWLHHVIFPAEAAHVNADLVYWGTLLAVAEMLQNGITTFCDGYFFEEYAARAALNAGIRGVLGQGILDYPCPDQPHPERARERAAAFLDAFPETPTDSAPPFSVTLPIPAVPKRFSG